jgi:hypothetical protein
LNLSQDYGNTEKFFCGFLEVFVVLFIKHFKITSTGGVGGKKTGHKPQLGQHRVQLQPTVPSSALPI